MLKCKLCNYVTKANLITHIRHSHNIVISEYIKKYGEVISKKTKNKIKKTLKKKFREGKLISPFKYIDSSGKNNGFYGKNHTEENKQKAVNTRYIKYDGKYFSKEGKINFHKNLIKAQKTRINKNRIQRNFKYEDIYFASSWEKELAKWFDKNNIQWIYEKKRFKVDDETYLPDFWLTEEKTFVEVKGYFNPKDVKKTLLFASMCYDLGFNFYLMMDYDKYGINFINPWQTEEFNVINQRLINNK